MSGIARTKRPAAIKYGQSNLDISDEMDFERRPLPGTRPTVPRIQAFGDPWIVDEVMRAERLDAILFPGASGAALAARAGYPTVIVPFGMIPNAPTPAFSARLRRQAAAVRRPSFTGDACSSEAARAGLRLRTGDKAQKYRRPEFP